jgi:translation initiation factor IF-2
MSDEKTIRLSKVTKDLNIGLEHLIEFLDSKGVKVERNPNTKISQEAYTLLQKEFQSDKLVKQDAIEITKEKIRKEGTIIEAPAPGSRSKTAEADSDEELLRNLNSIKKEAADKEKHLKDKPAAKEEPVAENKEAAKEKEKEKAEPEVIKAKSKKAPQPKVVGTIDLEELKAKGKKKTKKAAAEEEAGKEEETKAKQQEEVSASKADAAAIPTEAGEDKTDEADKEVPFRTEREKLTGPTILGKIDLPVDPPKKKPVASSSESDRTGKKKKRKRTDKKISSSDQPGTAPETKRPGDHQQQRRGDRPGDNRFKKDGRGGSVPKAEPTEKEIQDQIKATLARLSGAGSKTKGSKYRKLKREAATQQAIESSAVEDGQQKVIKVTEFVSANELAKLIGIPVTDIISSCMSLGMFVSINQRLDAETLSVVAEEFGCKVEFVSADVQEAIQEKIDSPEDLKPRAPIVTVMGHVDHGKTSLLDYIRKANVIAGEAGGITQHIGAYEVQLENGKAITFLDTPGHEAFTAMRARGAKVTDVAIIVVAADDSVMPQTIEAINHAQAAGVPIVFALNKVDKPDANPDRIKEQLSKMNILVEEWGGKYQCQDISAKKGSNIDLLLEKVLLEAELLDLKANPDKNAIGTVIESSLDKGRGYITTILVQAGTLKVGDIMLAGCHSGRVKAMFNERGQRMNEAGPSAPVMILGLNGAPQAGDTVNVMDDEREARDIANKRLQLQREQGIRTHKHITLDEIGRRLAIGNFKELNVIVKGDVDGSIEALSDSVLKLSNPEIQINVIHKSVGQITESDVLLASASNAIIIGFQVRPSVNARKLAEQEQIDIRLYSIIYDAINELKAAMEGMLAPEFEEKITCNIEIRETFNIPKAGTIAGCMVLEGKVTRNTKVRIVRDGIVVYTGELASLRRFKEDVKEVSAGYECGLNINKFNDIRVGDIIEGYEQVAVKRVLA